MGLNETERERHDVERWMSGERRWMDRGGGGKMHKRKKRRRYWREGKEKASENKDKRQRD